MIRNEVEFEDVATLMKAIVKIADGQYDLKTSVDHLSDKVARLEDRIPQEDEIVKVFKDYMKLSPEEISLANTMGYRYDGVVDVLSMKEIKGRLNRMQWVFPDFSKEQWRREVCHCIGKNFKEIRMEAQAFNIKNGCPKVVSSLYDAIETIPEYLKWGTKILYDLEKKYGIHQNLYTKYDLFTSQNREFNSDYVHHLNPIEMRAWLDRRVIDMMKMCNTDEKGAKAIIARIFIQRRFTTLAHRLEFSGDLEKDFETICNETDDSVPRYSIFTSLKCWTVYVMDKCFVI